MSYKSSATLFALFTLVLIAIVSLAFNIPAQAQVQIVPTIGGENNCINCHEDLYFLHDTGKWFCIRESPMTCANCHEGDPNATTKELAHAHRTAHPIINDDVSKCRECHPEKADERVNMFDQMAGISTILVAAPYTSGFITENSSVVPVQITKQGPSAWIHVAEVIQTVLFISVASIVYIVSRIRHSKKGKR